MKVNGTGQGPTTDVSGAEASGDPSAKKLEKNVERVGASTPGKAFAEKLSAGRPTEAVAPVVQQPGQVVRTGPVRATEIAVADVAADLQAGKVTAQGAIDRVVEKVVAQQVGPDAPAAVREQIREALRSAIEDDPLLVAKLNRLQS